MAGMFERAKVAVAREGPDPQEMQAYRAECALLARMGFLLCNTGSVLVEDLRVVVEIPKLHGLRVLEELPDRPRSPSELTNLLVSRLALESQHVVTRVEDAGTHWKVLARIGKIQPSASEWSKPFWIGSPLPQNLDLVATVCADNLPRRIAVLLPRGIRLECRPTSRPDDEAGASTGAEHTPVCEHRSAATAQSAGRIVGRR
jgi:hypothetical protein